ncbi:MAG: hypothetical protein AAFO81_06535 [Pseudomonadota bacterium]
MSDDPSRVLPSALCLQILDAYLTPAQRERLAVCHAMRDQILSAAQTRQEVLPVKLAWWQEEINRLAAGEARHPVSKAVARVVTIDAHRIGLIEEWLTAARRDALSIAIESATALRIDAFRRHGTPLMLAWDVASDDQATPLVVSHCALAMTLLDHDDALIHTDERTSDSDSDSDSDDMLAQHTRDLASVEPAAAPLPAWILTQLLYRAHKRVQQNKTIQPLRLTLTGWQAARKWRKRNPT